MLSIDLNDPVAVLLAASSAFESANIQASAYGGLALAAYGNPRETKDADFAIATTETRNAEAAVRKAGFDVVLAFDRMRFGGQFVSRLTLISSGSTNTVDLVEPRSPSYADRVLGRSILGELRGQKLKVVSPEDFIILKILATRDRDLEDAFSVMLSLAGRIDVSLIEKEIHVLAFEVADHDVDGRWQLVQQIG